MVDPYDNLRRVDPGYSPPKGKISFSKVEIAHIAVAIIVLSAAFSIIMRRNVFVSDPVTNMLYIVGLSFLLVICSFLLHEFGHKFVAQRYHAWSEFRAYPMGLLIALLFSFTGILFAAPGAVYIRGNITEDMNGKISLAGPGVNFIISAVAIVGCLLSPTVIVAYVFFMLAYLNAFLGLFNLIPIPPFDGSKIVKWNLPIYLLAVVIGIAELAFILLYL